MKSKLTPQPLTTSAFAPFGTLITAAGPSRLCNDGRATRFFDLAPLRHDARATRPELSIYRVTPSALPLSVDYLERHPGSTQLFFPSTPNARYLVVVAGTRADGSPDEERLAAFVGASGQGVAYAPGVWHYPLVTLDAAADFLMFIFEAGDAYDCETRPIAARVIT